jgi:competence protein ComEC
VRSGTIAVLLGVVGLQQLADLPDPFIVEFLPICLFFAAACPRLRCPLFVCSGFLFALMRAELVLATTLPAALEGRDMRIGGTVVSIPAASPERIRFLFEVERTEDFEVRWQLPARVRLNWYGRYPNIHPGERWVLTVRLKRPRGFMNPGGFGYERWLFQHRVDATGYVRPGAQHEREPALGGQWITRVRAQLAQSIQRALGDDPHQGMVQALAVGVRDALSEDQWRVLRVTGTGHLMAISGLHVGLVAGAAFFVGRWLWGLCGSALLVCAAQRVGALTAVFAALLYAALAGFAVPTQRALVMVCVVMAGIVAGRHVAPSVSLAWALLVLLVFDPFDVLSLGFWLSFGAVAVILLGMTGRLSMRSLWWRWGRVQWLVAIGLSPLTLLFFQQQALVAPLANLFAVPWTSMVVVPLTLSGVALSPWVPGVGEPLLRLAALGLEWQWSVLAWLADLELVHRVPQPPTLWVVASAAVGVLLFLLPRGVPGRWVALLWLLPLCLLPRPRPGEGELWFTLLEVGQGLSAVVMTRERVLVYDTGPRFSAEFDAARAALLPFLRSQGIEAVDLLVLSHGDRDHVGGMNSLRAALPVRRTLGLAGGTQEPCQRGQSWRWNSIEFLVLHPPPGRAGMDNDDSCVLKIAAPGGTVLLTGDIERETELALVAEYQERLASDVLVVPHHGSRTSSATSFLEAAHPRYALFSVGYRNRLGLPAPSIAARYRAHGVTTFDTAQHGAITFVVAPNRGVVPPSLYRVHEKRYWHRADSNPAR